MRRASGRTWSRLCTATESLIGLLHYQCYCWKWRRLDWCRCWSKQLSTLNAGSEVTCDCIVFVVVVVFLFFVLLVCICEKLQWPPLPPLKHANLCSCHFKAILSPVAALVFFLFLFFLHEIIELCIKHTDLYRIEPNASPTHRERVLVNTLVMFFGVYCKCAKKKAHVHFFFFNHERMNAYVADMVRCAGRYCFHGGPSFPSVVVC